MCHLPHPLLDKLNKEKTPQNHVNFYYLLLDKQRKITRARNVSVRLTRQNYGKSVASLELTTSLVIGNMAGGYKATRKERRHSKTRSSMKIKRLTPEEERMVQLCASNKTFPNRGKVNEITCRALTLLCVPQCRTHVIIQLSRPTEQTPWTRGDSDMSG